MADFDTRGVTNTSTYEIFALVEHKYVLSLDLIMLQQVVLVVIARALVVIFRQGFYVDFYQSA